MLVGIIAYLKQNFLCFASSQSKARFPNAGQNWAMDVVLQDSDFRTWAETECDHPADEFAASRYLYNNT